MTLGLFAQSWDSSVEDTWTQEHATTIIDFALIQDGELFQHTAATHSPNFTIAAIVDGQYRGKATNVILNDASGMAIGSYFSMTVYGITDPTDAQKQNTLAGKEITLHLYDAGNKLEYILPQTFTFDGEHHGTLEDLEEVSYTTVTELRLADRNIYPGGEFDLNEGLSLFHGDALVEDGTQVLLNGWRLTSNSPAMPQGYTLDSQTGILTTSDEAEATTINYSVTAGNLSGTGSLTLYYSVQGIEVFENPVEVLVGSYVSRFIQEGVQFDIYPNTADQDYTLTYVKEGFITDGYAQTAGETEVIITSTADPTKTASLTLKVYDDATSISVSEDVIYMPSTTEDVYAFLKPYITINPETAKQDFEFASFNGDIFQMDNFGKLSIIGTGESEMMVVPALYENRVSASFTVIVYEPITKVVFPQNPIDVLVGDEFIYSVLPGEQFYFTNAAGNSEGVWEEYSTALAPEDIVNSDDMFAYPKEGAKVTITPVTNPEAAADLTINVYDRVKSVDAYNVRIPNTLKTHDEIYAAIMSQVTILPETAKQALTFDNFTSSYLTVSENIFSLSGATGSCRLRAHAFGMEDAAIVNVTVYAPVTKVVINQNPLDMLVGESTLKQGIIDNFYFEPTDGTISEYTVEYSDPTIVDEEGFIVKAVPEGVTVTIRPATNPEVTGTFTLRTFDRINSISIKDNAEKVRIPNSLYGKGHAAIYTAIMEQVVIEPATAKQELTFHSSSNMDVINFNWDSKQNPLLNLPSTGIVGETDLTARAYGYDGETEPVITVEVYQPAGDIEILEEVVDAPVGASIYDWISVGPNGHYQIIPYPSADQTVTVTAADKSIMDDEGKILQKGSTTITLASVANPELKGTITLNAYIEVTGYELYEGDELLWSSTELPEGEDTGYINILMDRLNKKTFTVRPIPADGDISKPFNGGNISIENESNQDNTEKTITVEPGEQYNFTPLYNEDGELNGLTFTVHAWRMGDVDTLAFEEDASAACICEIYVQVGADVHPVDGWDWVTVWSSYGTDDSGTLNYLNDAEHYGGGLIDVRSQTAHLYKDPQYGLYGTLDYMGPDDGCYKMKFDASQATEMASDYFINYDVNVEDGAGDTWSNIEKGWNWMAYPFQFDYTMSELGIMDYSNAEYVPAVAGDVILASDGSMLTFNATTNKWISSEGTDYTFRYGKGYLYYTTLEAEHSGFEWGIGRELEPKDLTTAEARARKFDRDASFWDYNPHQYPNHMAIIAKLEGLDNLEDFSIGAFVDDECRGEGKAAEEWMFITVNGDDKEYVTFRLIDKRTGICYDLSESFQFGGVSGSLKEPVIFRTGDIASGIANVTEGNALIVQGNVATAAGTIQVYDIQGKVVAEGFQRIDMSHLNSGVYVVKAGNTSRKVIK